MLNIVLFGPPGAGKGTQAEFLKSEYNLYHISTGDLLREEMKNQTKLGNEARLLIDAGKLVPDNVVIGMMEKKINENRESNGFIFDGFPRTVEQAKALDEMVGRINASITAMIILKVEEKELVNRLSKRGETSGRKDDSDPEIIRRRIREYEEKTAPVASYYASHKKYHEVDGMGTIDEISLRLQSTVNAIAK